ncbi:hypothetical protein PR003_g21333 [Phytophthora rubi]|uniref:Uncharacterized protein n=1 Tax=Phytophthora rubi TaxID=129364 RepID=A0A6A4DEY3_9STRA|nr:hypothetical protein PR003_g21333 [Phytophthora rubi]
MFTCRLALCTCSRCMCSPNAAAFGEHMQSAAVEDAALLLNMNSTILALQSNLPLQHWILVSCSATCWS